MSRTFRSLNKTARFLVTALCLAAGLSTYGAMAMPPVLAAATAAAAVAPIATSSVVVASGSLFPAVSSTTVANYEAACDGNGTSSDSVPICQQPLTIQPTVPPNITLMLDDSGSMAWNFMPDWSYLSNNSNNNAVIDSSNNGVYYNPTVTYTAPPQATGASYTSYTDMTSVPFDGFALSGNVNLYTYDGSDDYYDCGGVCQGSSIDYNTSSTHNVTTTSTYAASCSQSTGDTGPDSSGTCTWTGITYKSTKHSSSQTLKGTQYSCSDSPYSGYYSCVAATGTYFGCKSGDTWDSVNQNCVNSTTVTKTFYFFQYSTGSASGPYTVYYVTANASDCQYAPTPSNSGTYGGCVGASDTSGSAAPAKDASNNALSAGTNIANWFAYYHTRILMAKTGLMTAFSTMDSGYRVGFGSINGNNTGGIPSPQYAFDDSGSGGGNSNNVLAEVQPFGDGSSGTQKANFWNWIIGESANNGTPLRKALQSVGNYYADSGQQAWSMMSSDPGYVSGGTNNTVIACRQAYTILTTDGFWNGSSPGVGDVDDTKGTTITGTNNNSFTYTPVQPFSDAVVTTTTSEYSGSCSSKSATGPDGSGNCNWVGIQYKRYWYSSTSTIYGSSYSCSNSPYKTYNYCAPVSGSYSSCNSGDTWNSSDTKCVHTTSTTIGTANSNTLADVAMYYWNHDLQTGIDNEVPTNTEDPAFWQHMVTFTMGLGFTPTNITPSSATTSQIFDWSESGGGTATAEDGTTNSPSNPNAISGFGWPTPSSNSINNIADLEHAGVNGHGGFFSATDPTTFINGIETALNRAAENTGSGASLAANSTQLQTGTVAYQATYHTVYWIGDLESYAINQSTGAFGSMGWSASAQLLASATKVASTGALTYPSRLVMTYNPSLASGSQFVAFQNASASSPPSLSTAELAALGTSAATQANMVNYLRGDNTLEGGTTSKPYRSRSTPLGDIIDSQPVYSGAPDANAFVGQTFTGSSSYSTFATNEASRTGLVWVAANDGMLHAFNATTGDEAFAYLPGAVITAGIANLANPTYGGDSNPHQDYNDGQLTIADAYFAEGTDAAAWHTVLVGTTGRGSAKAIYALDITDPTSIKFLWERSAADGLSNSGYIGQMVGKPVVALTSTDATKGPTWSVLIGNGYNSAQNKAALLQFDLATGTVYVHQTDSSTSNGLAAPVTWIGTAGNGLSTDAYAGDLLGRVWDFALNTTSCNTATPPVCTTSATPTSTGTKLFTAQDSSGTAQPISAGLLAGMDPNTSYVWVFFGTGKYLQYDDVKSTSPQTQSWYGVIVQQGGAAPTSMPITTSNSKMVQRYITSEQAATSTTLAARTVTATPTTSDMTGKLGWYMNLQSPSTSGGTTTYTSQGEMMVDPNQFQSNLLLGTTRIPIVSDVCNPSGTGWIMALSPFTGTAPSSDFFDLNGDGVVNSSDEIGGKAAAGVGFSSMPNAPIFVGGSMLTSFENATKSSLTTAGAAGAFARVSWREIINQ